MDHSYKRIHAIILISLSITSINLVSTSISSKQKNVVCYIPEWGSDLTSKVDTSLCTMFIVAFATVDNNGKIGLPSRFTRFQKLKTPTSKLLIAISGVNAAGRKAFSKISSTAVGRARFAENCVNLVKNNKLDGIDIDWEFPVKSERNNFVHLLQDIRKKFNNTYILTTAVSAGAYHIKNVYDVPNIANIVDQINIMAYDMHMDAQWDIPTGVYFNAPIDARFGDYSNKTIKLYLDRGAPAHKLMLGIPFYARVYQLSDPNRTAPRSPFVPGMQKQAVNTPAYSVYCRKFTDSSWIKKRDELTRCPYMYHGNSWISYEDEESVKEKVKLAKKYNLGGVMVWSLRQDDYKKACSSCDWFLLRTINLEIGRSTTLC